MAELTNGQDSVPTKRREKATWWTSRNRSWATRSALMHPFLPSPPGASNRDAGRRRSR